MNKIPQHIIDKANNAVAKGAKMTFEAICEMYMKQEAKTAKKFASKKEAAKWEARGKEYTGVVPPIEELMKQSAINCLPSSMRKY